VLLARLAEEKDAQVRLALVAQGEPVLHFIFDAKALLAHLDKEEDPIIRHVAVNALKQAAGRNADAEGKVAWNWRNLEERFDEIVPKGTRGVQALLDALLEEYDPAAVRVVQRLAKSDKAAVRQQAIDVLAHAYKERKPYAGGWWGTQPAGQKPPAPSVAWEGTPAVRDALRVALGDRDAGVRKAALAGLVRANDTVTLEPLVKLFDAEKDEAARADVVRAVAGLPSPAAGEFLSTVLGDDKNSEAVRLEAIAG